MCFKSDLLIVSNVILQMYERWHTASIQPALVEQIKIAPHYSPKILKETQNYDLCF